MPKHIILINGSYRADGNISQAICYLAHKLNEEGCHCEIISLNEEEIKFCTNCRNCTQTPGTAPGECVLDDGMSTIVEKLEQADAYVFASPTNMGTVTAVYKRFMERLILYAYWPWGNHAPKYRKANEFKKPAILIASSAMPGIMGRLMTNTMSIMDFGLKAAGAKRVGSLYMGMAASGPLPSLQEHHKKKLAKLAKVLV